MLPKQTCLSSQGNSNNNCRLESTCSVPGIIQVVFLILTRILQSIFPPFHRWASQGTNRLNGVLRIIQFNTFWDMNPSLTDRKTVFYTILRVSTCRSRNMGKEKSSSDYCIFPPFLFQDFLKKYILSAPVRFIKSYKPISIPKLPPISTSEIVTWILWLWEPKIQIMTPSALCFISLKRNKHLFYEHLVLLVHTLSHVQFTNWYFSVEQPGTLKCGFCYVPLE